MIKKSKLGPDPLEWVKGGEIMGKKWMVAVLIFVLIIFGFSRRSIADCKSDCQDTYESAVESCKEQYDDPDDADMFKMCIDNAKSEYESCIGECENLDQGDSQETKKYFFCLDASNPSLSFERPSGMGVKIDWGGKARIRPFRHCQVCY